MNEQDSVPGFVFHENPSNIDLVEVSRLLDRVHMRTRPVDLLSRAIAGSMQTVVVLDEKRVVIGFGRLISDGVYYGTLWDIAVHPDFQKRGIGVAIVTRMLKKCKDLNLTMVGLFTAEHNLGFYETFGFEMIDQIHAMTLVLEHFQHQGKTE